MKKSIWIVLLSCLIALLSLAGEVTPAFASTAMPRSRSAMHIRNGWAHFHPGSWQTHHQYFHGSTYSGLHLTFRGHNQNNSGNQGHNRGFNQNFGGNGGNMIANHRRASRYQRTYQSFHGISYSRSSLDFVGYNQNNSGNQGDNEGYNEDHGSNAGNQIVN